MGVEGPRRVGGGVSGCRGPIGLQHWLPTTGMPGPHPPASQREGGQQRPPDADIWVCLPTRAWAAELKGAVPPCPPPAGESNAPGPALSHPIPPAHRLRA